MTFTGSELGLLAISVMISVLLIAPCFVLHVFHPAYLMSPFCIASALIVIGRVLRNG